MILIVTVLISVSAFVILDNTGADESSAQNFISSEPCGPNARYYLYSDGTLEIVGYGEMCQYDTTHAPWYECREDITKIVICDQITKLGASAFLDCKNVTELTIPITLNSVVSDKNPVFSGCCNIEKINLICGNSGYGVNYAAYPVSNSWYQNTPWYQSRDALKEINFADGVKTIGSDTFRELNIASIVLPDSLIYLGNHCFYNCTKLTDLTIPVSLNPYGGEEKYPAFHRCTAVQKVTFTKGNGVPFDYKNFWGEHNTELAPWNANSDIAKTIVVADDVTKLGEDMFLGCNLKELTIPISIHLDYDVSSPFNRADSYQACVNLEKVILTKGTGTSTAYCEYGAGYCPWNIPYKNHTPNTTSSKITSVIVEEGVTDIGMYTFCKCNIENLILPNSLVSLDYRAIYACMIKNLTIPISLNATWLNDDLDGLIANYPAFDKVSGIERVDFTPGSGCGFDYVAKKENNCWYQHTPWYQCRDTLKEINLQEGITHIGSNAFRDCTPLTTIIIPSSVTEIGSSAFRGCTSLQSITIPDSVTYIGESAFEGCSLLSSVKMPNTIKSIESSTFRGCTSLSSITIPDSVETIEASAFQSCISLPLISLPDSVTYLGESAFEGCSLLSSFKMSNSIKLIDSSAFRGCTSLPSITIPDSVTYLGESAFEGCSLLSSFKMPNIIKSIEPFTFRDCTSLPTIAIPVSVETIGASAFQDCTSLHTIIIPDSVTYLGESAFEGCSILSSVKISNSIKSIESFTFRGCISLQSIFIPDSVETIGLSAFQGCTSLTSLNLGNSIISVGGSAFKSCNSLTSLVIHGYVTIAGDDAFDGKFYDSDGKMELEPTATMLADSTFNKVDGKWIKQVPTPSEDPPVSGGCGENVTYELDISTGTLAINGFGQMDNYNQTNSPWFHLSNAPWFSYKNYIKTVVIGNSVTSIGDNAFYCCTSITYVNIPDSITSIGKFAFDGKFYNGCGKAELEPTATNLAGSTFMNIDGKWIKLGPYPSVDPNKLFGICGENVTYEFNLFTGTLSINGSG